MDDYQFPIFFEHQSLDKEQIRKIKLYFNIRRKSGGGDCGPLQNVDSNIYRIAFRLQRDQQAVLQRCQHTVEGLVLTVRDSLDPGCSTLVSASTASQSVRAAEQETFLQVQNKAEAVRGSDSSSLDLTDQVDQISTPKRIVLLGKTGSGKSSTANTIFGESLFCRGDKVTSGTRKCQAETKTVGERIITLIDTPGFFDTDMPEEELRSEILRCITECAPGPHAFLIVLKVERYTEQEQDVITKICQCFSEDALKYAVIVFTHGNDLDEGQNIEDFISNNKNLSELVKKCGGRCHVVDNKYWSNKATDNYRNNQFQIRNILDTIDKLESENNGCYTNEMLQKVEKKIQIEAKRIRQFSGEMQKEEEIREQAKTIVQRRILIKLAGVAMGSLLGFLLGAPKLLVFNLADVCLDTLKGGTVGYMAADGAKTPLEAVKKAAAAVFRKN